MFSIILPMDLNRLDQFEQTKKVYDMMPQRKEFIVPTRTKGLYDILKKRGLTKDLITILYSVESGFNCSKALNIGVKNAQYPNIIITSPEVKPTTDVLEQLSEYKGKNVVCQVFDQDESGNITVLVSKIYRGDTPAMYFLAMFQKKDIEKINGWDEEFMKGYAYEDNDFGDRWKRAQIPFEVAEEIQAVHQYHPRTETIKGGTVTNQLHYYDNNDKGIIRCANGLYKL